MISYVDLMLGGLLSLSLSSSNVILSTAQSRNALIRLSGVLLANVQITTSCVGFFFVDNACTGNFAVTITNGVAGVVVPRGTRATVIADSTNGCRLASQYIGFVGGTTKQVFNNVTVPTGWTIDATVNNGTFRLVSGTGGGSGGTADFTTALGARTIVIGNLPDHTVTITDPGHAHGYNRPGASSLGTGGAQANNPTAGTTDPATTGITAAFGTTARGGAQTAMDFAVKYVDCVRGTLNA
jgi:hypothetical protein